MSSRRACVTSNSRRRLSATCRRLVGLSQEHGGDGAYTDLRTVLAAHARVCPRAGCEDGLAASGKPISEIDDEEMLRAEFPRVRVLLDEYFAYAQAQQPRGLRDGDGNASSPEAAHFNMFLLRALSDAASFVTIQGGISYIASYFGGCNKVTDMYGDTFKPPRGKEPFVPPCVNASAVRRSLYGEAHRNASGGGGGGPVAVRRRASDGASTAVAAAASTPVAKPNEQEEAEERERARRRRRRRRRLSETAQPRRRRRLSEIQRTYEDALPRLSGARVTKHMEASELLEAVRGWFSHPQCGLIGTPPAT